MYKVLLADDDDGICTTVGEFLRVEKYLVDIARSGSEAKHFIRDFSYDIIMLDWEMPDKTGIEVCQEFRAAGGMTPILMLTGRQSVSEKEEGLDAGADDYVTKPFHFNELGARLRALLRRPPQIIVDVVSVRNIVLDPKSKTVSKNGQSVRLQPMEFVVLEFFFRHPGEMFSAEMLVQRLWDSDSDVSLSAIYSCIKRLRKKLDVEGEPSLISSSYGTGYRLDP